MNNLFYQNIHFSLNNKIKKFHLIKYEQQHHSHLTLLISKVSEAIEPNTINNHIGEGGSIDLFLQHQIGVRFIINAGFSHYRKNFYNWHHQNFNVGDPVGIIKVREHLFEDYLDIEHYGFLVQKDKNSLWQIVKYQELDKTYKYILGCTPLLIFNQELIELPISQMQPVPLGKINPPSYLGHGLENHPRTAVGIKENEIYFIVVDGGDANEGGCTLLELQKIGEYLKMDSLLNLDGGGSSQFRLMTKNGIIKNNTTDNNRVLGHVLVIFDEKLKNY